MEAVQDEGLTTWRWTREAFVLAWESGVFGHRSVELVNGEVLNVVHGRWHARAVARVIRVLPEGDCLTMSGTLPAGEWLPDPDLFVYRRDAAPVAEIGAKEPIAVWRADDVPLVIEISASTYAFDTRAKAELYGAAGYPVYWVVHRGGIEVFTEPFDEGYRRREHVDADGEVVVPYTGEALAVAELLDVD